MARVKLKVQKALELAEARKRKGLSQYELADQLKWPRSKIKRIEKAEVLTIEEKDLKKLCKRLGVKVPSNVLEPAQKKALSKKRSSRKSNVVSMFKEEGLFTNVFHLVDRTGWKNQVFFEVTMAKEMKAEELLRVGSIELLGVTGSINGVENTIDQNPLRYGDRVVIMLWGSGIGVNVGNLNKKKRPGARTSA